MLGPRRAPYFPNHHGIIIDGYNASAAARGHETDVAGVTARIQDRSRRQFPQRFGDERFLSGKLLNAVVVPTGIHIPGPCGLSPGRRRQMVQRALQTMEKGVENESGLL